MTIDPVTSAPQNQFLVLALNKRPAYNIEKESRHKRKPKSLKRYPFSTHSGGKECTSAVQRWDSFVCVCVKARDMAVAERVTKALHAHLTSVTGQFHW